MFWTFLKVLALLEVNPTLSKLPTDADLVKAPKFDRSLANKPIKGYTPFWLCSDIHTAPVRVMCDDLGYNRLEGRKAELQLSLNLDGTEHSYGLRHGILTSECRLMRREISKLLKKGRAYCIGGQLAGVKREAHEIGWVFFEIKTDHGSVCDFCEWPAVVHERN